MSKYNSKRVDKPTTTERNNRSKASNGAKRNADRNSKRDFRSSNVPTKEYCRVSADKLAPLNDFSWYNKNPNLTVAAASIPFPYRPGMQMDVASYIKDPGTTTVAKLDIPGVMSLEWLPGVGRCSAATDPASIAAKEIYAKVREAFSGAIDADAPDFVIYLLALDSIFSYIGALKRLYRVIATYSPQNLMVPDTILQAYGLDANARSQIREHRMELYGIINQLIGMTQKFRCPAVFDLFNRHYWMNDNVYTDAPSANSQMYMFTQAGFLKFSMLPVPGKEGINAGGLTMVEAPFKSLEIATEGVTPLFTFGRSLIDALAGSDDAYLISGYLMRAFDNTPVFRVDELQINELLEPVYVPSVLAQIENSWTASVGYSSLSNLTIAQDPSTNALVSGYTGPANDTKAVEIKPIISIRSDAPTVEDVVEATRLKVTREFTTGSTIYHYASELPMRWVLYGSQLDQGIKQSLQIRGNTVSMPYLLATTSVLAQFDWHPICAIWYAASDSSHYVPYIVGDIHNFTTLSMEQLDEIHRVCLYSEMNSFGIY